MKKLKGSPPKQNNSNKNSKRETESRKEIDAQKFFDMIMHAVKDTIASELIPIKRDIKDIKFRQKVLLKRIMNTELDFKALGLSLGQLGLVEINLLDKISNTIKQKISVTDSKGGIKGRIDVHRFNSTPSSNKLMVEVTNELKNEGNVQ